MFKLLKKKPKLKANDNTEIISDEIEALTAARDAMREAAIKNAESQGHLEDLMKSALQRITNNG